MKTYKEKRWELEIYLKGRKPGKKKCKASNGFTCFWNILCHWPAALAFSTKEVQRLCHFALKFCFHTKPSSTDKQNIETNCNGIKLHWWKFKLLYKQNGYQLDVFKDTLIYQKQAWKIMLMVWLMMLQLIQCNCRVLLLGFFSPFSCFGFLLCWYDFTCQIEWLYSCRLSWLGKLT